MKSAVQKVEVTTANEDVAVRNIKDTDTKY